MNRRSRCSPVPVKLVVGLCMTWGSLQRHPAPGCPAAVFGDVGRLLTTQLLRTCNPAPSDVHDPTVPHSRSRSRGRDGKDRESLMPAGAAASRRSGFWRKPQAEWDTAPFQDYGGRWCNRLLLGPDDVGGAKRTALLEPVPGTEDESLTRVFRSHRHLKPSDVLFVRACTELPLGTMRFRHLCESEPVLPTRAGGFRASVAHWKELLLSPTGSQSALSEFPSLCIGISSCAPMQPLDGTAAEWPAVTQRILPLGAFACALWTFAPVQAAKLLLESTTCSLQPPTDKEDRLWRRMQTSLLSTRDAAVLEAFSEGRSVERNLRGDATAYQAEQILRREGKRIFGRW